MPLLGKKIDHKHLWPKIQTDPRENMSECVHHQYCIFLNTWEHYFGLFRGELMSIQSYPRRSKHLLLNDHKHHFRPKLPGSFSSHVLWQDFIQLSYFLIGLCWIHTYIYDEEFRCIRFLLHLRINYPSLELAICCCKIRFLSMKKYGR